MYFRARQAGKVIRIQINFFAVVENTTLASIRGTLDLCSMPES